MNFNPNAMMQKQVERMISQRFGSVDNMMNDMSKFAGNNPTLKNALDLYKNSDLKRAASQDRQSALLTTAMASQTQQLINAINPAAIPAYVVPNPNTYYGGCNGYSNGCC